MKLHFCFLPRRLGIYDELRIPERSHNCVLFNFQTSSNTSVNVVWSKFGGFFYIWCWICSLNKMKKKKSKFLSKHRKIHKTEKKKYNFFIVRLLWKWHIVMSFILSYFTFYLLVCLCILFFIMILLFLLYYVTHSMGVFMRYKYWTNKNNVTLNLNVAKNVKF